MVSLSSSCLQGEFTFSIYHPPSGISLCPVPLDTSWLLMVASLPWDSEKRTQVITHVLPWSLGGLVVRPRVALFIQMVIERTYRAGQWPAGSTGIPAAWPVVSCVTKAKAHSCHEAANPKVGCCG